MRIHHDPRANLILIAILASLFALGCGIVSLSRMVAPLFRTSTGSASDASSSTPTTATQSQKPNTTGIASVPESAATSVGATVDTGYVADMPTPDLRSGAIVAPPTAAAAPVILAESIDSGTGIVMHAAPNAQSAVLSRLDLTSAVLVTGRTETGDWYHVRVAQNGQSREGWVMASVVRLRRATAMPVAAPTETATPQPLQASANIRPVQVYETVVSIPTYAYGDALVPTQAGDAIFPYPRLDFARVGPPQPRTYKAIVLESGGTAIVIAPELGGRVLRWFDKRLQREVLFSNSVLKPVQNWGYRGWWMATGGIEIAFPTHEHGLLDASPWHYNLGQDARSARVRVCTHEARTELDVCVTWLLRDDDRLQVIPQIANKTSQPKSFQFWLNIALPHSPNASFELPTDGQVVVHSTGDMTLPVAGQTMPWPQFASRDFATASAWQKYLGVFAHQVKGTVASVANPDLGNRMVLRFPEPPNRGLKLFLLGDLPSDLYTDDGRRYLELWSGVTRTFDEQATIQPGQTLQWVEELTSQALEK